MACLQREGRKGGRNSVMCVSGLVEESVENGEYKVFGEGKCRHR